VKRKGQRDLAKVSEAIAGAQDEYGRADRELGDALADAQELTGRYADAALGVADHAEVAREEAKVEGRLAVAEAKRERAEAILAELSRRGASLAEEIAANEVAAAEKKLREAAAAVEATLAALREREQERDEAELVLTRLRRAQLDAARDFDEDAADAAAARAAQDGEAVDWHARANSPPQRVPVLLREAVEERRQELLRERERDRERLQAKAIQSWVDAGAAREQAEDFARVPLGNSWIRTRP